VLFLGQTQIKSIRYEIYCVDIIAMIIDIVGGMIDTAFEMSKDSALQEWANDVIFKAADHGQEVVEGQLASTPELSPKDDVALESDYFL